MGYKPLGDAPGFEAGKFDPASKLINPLVASGKQFASFGGKIRDARKALRAQDQNSQNEAAPQANPTPAKPRSPNQFASKAWTDNQGVEHRLRVPVEKKGELPKLVQHSQQLHGFTATAPKKPSAKTAASKPAVKTPAKPAAAKPTPRQPKKV